MRTKLVRLIALPWLLLALACPASAQHEDAEVERVISDYYQTWMQLDRASTSREDIARVQDEGLQGLDIAELSIHQLSRLWWLGKVLTRDVHRAHFVKRLHDFDDDQGVDGVGAAILWLMLEGSVQDGFAGNDRRLAAVLAHPALSEALLTGPAEPLFEAISDRTTPAQQGFVRDELLGLEELIEPGFSPFAAVSLGEFYKRTLLDLVDEEAVLERWRIKILAVLQAARDGVTGDTSRAEAERIMLDHHIGQLSGAAARDELVGNPAPALDFRWASRPGLSSLDDLRGKVVVLDFWATWCGPCLGSFDKLRELQARYADSPLEIVGVTSLQGSLGSENTEGKPEREFELMAAFMEERDMTWTVAFSEQPVFNPDYGVSGIPHVVLLDRRGHVAYSGPSLNMDSRIDAILSVPADTPIVWSSR